MRKFFITDIHGDYKGMMQLLKYSRFDPTTDSLIFGGDFIDRGIESGKVVKEAKRLCDKYPDSIKAVDIFERTIQVIHLKK